MRSGRKNSGLANFCWAASGCNPLLALALAVDAMRHGLVTVSPTGSLRWSV